MINYEITEEELWNRIEALKPTWRTRAAERRNAFIAAGSYNESSNIWGEIKKVYVELQKSKCGYCEKKLAGPRFGLIEHDVEHFRPKSSVSAYPPLSNDAHSRHELRYDFPTGDGSERGYHELAYHPLNYLASCKICNTILKSDYFPLAAGRITGAIHPRDLSDEQPFLVYPIGDLDSDPRTLIGFDGPFAIPIATTQTKRRRAQLTIDFFKLNTRDDLLPQRAELIHVLYVNLSNLPQLTSEESKQETQRHIDYSISDKAQHSNCASCFHRLFHSDPGKARKLALESQKLYDPDKK